MRAALGLDPGARATATAAPAPLPPGERELVEFPTAWNVVEERNNESWPWPKRPDQYDPFTVYEGATSKGAIRLAIGRCTRPHAWGKERVYLTTFYITPGEKRPLCEFVETDDYAETDREMVAIIRGTGASKRGMYDPSAALPGAYGALPVGVYSDHIRAPRSWAKQAVIAREDDIETMLNHSLIQADLRFDIRPS